MSAPTSLPTALRQLPWPGRLALVALLVAAAGLTLRLWPHWRTNPDLSHGYFMPLLFLLLLTESRQGTPRYLRPGWKTSLPLIGLLAAGLLSLFVAGLYAVSADWSYSRVIVMMTLSMSLFTGAAAIVFAGSSVRLIGLNWPVVAAALLWLLTTPIPPGTYSRLTLTLQLWVSEGVLRTLHLLGIAAIRHGNIIDLANSSVGVEEACSGVRSLISCLFAGVFFSATLVSRTGARILIIGLAAPLALGMNFLRSLVLTLLANGGVDINGTWHDATGFAVLGLTAVILGALALLLERGRDIASPPAPAPEETQAPTGSQWVLLGGFTAAAILAAFFVIKTRPAVHGESPVPNLAAIFPQAEGWQARSPDLFEYRSMLQTDHLAQREYLRSSADSAVPTEIIFYLAYWRPGQVPVSQVAIHTPDACWPGSGWTMLPQPTPRVTLTTGNRRLPEAEYRVFESGGRPHHVWFWHLHDRRPIFYRDPYNALDLLEIAWKYGFRRDGDQLFVRVSSNRSWAEIRHEPLVRDFFTRIQSLGL